jgi:hypothetical protein
MTQRSRRTLTLTIGAALILAGALAWYETGGTCGPLFDPHDSAALEVREAAVLLARMHDFARTPLGRNAGDLRVARSVRVRGREAIVTVSGDRPYDARNLYYAQLWGRVYGELHHRRDEPLCVRMTLLAHDGSYLHQYCCSSPPI